MNVDIACYSAELALVPDQPTFSGPRPRPDSAFTAHITCAAHDAHAFQPDPSRPKPEHLTAPQTLGAECPSVSRERSLWSAILPVTPSPELRGRTQPEAMAYQSSPCRPSPSRAVEIDLDPTDEDSGTGMVAGRSIRIVPAPTDDSDGAFRAAARARAGLPWRKSIRRRIMPGPDMRGRRPWL
jgi:hypothetical protein